MPLLGVTECYGDLTQGPTQKIMLMVSVVRVRSYSETFIKILAYIKCSLGQILPWDLHRKSSLW